MLPARSPMPGPEGACRTPAMLDAPDRRSLTRSMNALVANLLLFGRVLRAAGLQVHHARLLDAVRALEWVGLHSRADVHAVLRSLLVHRRDDLAVFDEAFDAFFRAHDTGGLNLPLFSLGERARVVARRDAGAPPRVGSRWRRSVAGRRGARRRRVQSRRGLAKQGLRRAHRQRVCRGPSPAAPHAVGGWAAADAPMAAVLARRAGPAANRPSSGRSRRAGGRPAVQSAEPRRAGRS